MKKILSLAIFLLGVTLFAVSANAETGNQEMQTTVDEGEFKVSFTEGGLTFGQIKNRIPIVSMSINKYYHLQ